MRSLNSPLKKSLCRRGRVIVAEDKTRDRRESLDSGRERNAVFRPQGPDAARMDFFNGLLKHVPTPNPFAGPVTVFLLALAVAVLPPAVASAQSNDAPGLIVDSPSVEEGDDGTTTLSFTATLDRPGTRPINASYEALSRPGNSATAGADYRTTSGLLTFAPGETSKSVDVTVIGDVEREDDETLTVFWLIWDSAFKFRATAFATGTITDDDTASAPDPAALTISDASADEGDAISFTVTLDKAVSGGLTVTPSFTDGTATKGTDYTENTTALTFSGTANETQTIKVSTTEDAEVEENETFTVGLSVSGTTHSVTATSTATGTITNDDEAPAPDPAAVTIADAGATEGKSIAFTVTLDKAVAGGFKVTPTFTDVTATQGTDYTASTTALDFVGAAGESVIFTVPTTDDPDAEADETFTVGLSVSGTTHSVTATSTATGTITNDDTASAPDPAALTISDAKADEGDAISFTVTLDKAVSGGFTVTPSFTDGTATKGADYTENTKALTFTGTANETQTFTVSTTEDTDIESNETFTVGLAVSGTTHSVTATSTATGTITNDDTAPAVTIADAKADEGDAISFTVTLDKAVSGGLTVTPSFTGGTAIKGTDYTENTKALTFTGTANETQTFSVSTTEDVDVEENETFTVGLAVSGTTHSVTATSTATGTITNDDTASAPDPAALTISDAKADEGDAISFTVTLDKAVPGGLTVTPSFTDGTATEGTDYTENTTALSFTGTANETQSFTVSTTEDTDIEADETFTVGLAVSGTSESVTATSTATGTITNDDTPAVTIADASANEGDSISFTVTLDKAVSGGLTVTPSFTDGTATKGTDYTENTTALSFTGAAGETVSFTVPTTQDGDVEEDETFTVGLSVSGTTHTVTATSTATGTITNDDRTEGASAASATISLSSSVTSRNEKDGAVTVTITATASSWIYDRTVTVQVGDQNDTATEGTDYNTVNSFTISITAFETSGTGTFTLTPKQDNLVEGDETITISGTEPTETVGSTTITLTDDEMTLSVSPKGGVLETSPKRNVAVTVTGSPLNQSRTVTVSVGKSGDSATEGTDYNTVANFNITLNANASSASGTFWFTPKDDNSAEGNETITISGTSSGYNVVSTSMTLIDNDVSLSVSPSSWGEQSASTSVRVTATSGANPQARTVRISVGKGSDSVKEGINYANVPDFDVKIPANATSGAADFTLTPYDDGVHRWGTAISIYGILPGAHVSGAWFTLTDDDYEPDFIISVDKSSVSESGGAQTIKVTVRDNRDETYGWIDVDIGVGKSHDSATEGTDYATVNDFRILGESDARSASGTFTLTPTNDSTAEGTERILVYSTDNSVHQYNPTFINLTDDDGGTITLSTDVSSVREDASATKVTITATADKQQPAARTLNVSLGSSGSATYGTDYTVGPNGYSFTLLIGKNKTSGTAWFNLTPTNDTVVEGNETMGISATSSGFSVTGTSVTLTDDDYHAVTLSANKSSVAESASATTVTVTATAKKAVSTARTVTVAVGSSSDGATEGTDYATVDNFDITIAANSKTGTGAFTLTPTEDTSVEGSETIGISGSGTQTNVTGTSMTLTDNDTYAVTLSASPDSVGEGASATSVTVTASATAISTARTVSVVVGSSTDSATEGTDYATVADFTVSISANQTTGTGTFTLTPTQDTSAEGNETIGVSGSGTLMTVTGTSMTLSDDDVRTITLSSNKTTVGEGAGATTVTVTATANAAVSEATTVTVSVGASGDGATEGTDYTTVADFDVTINANATTGTGTFTLTPTDDSTYEGEESVSITGASSPHTVTGTSLAIGNNDGIAISLSASPDSLLEGGGATTVTVTATAAQTILAATDVTVSVGKSTDSATEGTDYPTVNDFTLTIAKGNTKGTATFSLIPNSDKRSAESDETISVDGSSSPHTVTGTSLTLRNASATNPITLSLSPSSVSEGDSATTVTVTARMHSSFVKAIQCTVTVGASGSATSGTDYAAVSDVYLTFAANSTKATGTFTLTPTDDSVVEPNETVWVDGKSTGRQVVGASVTIADDDGAGITLSANKTSVSEGASATTVTVTATPANTSATARTVTVSVGSTGDAAISGTDYADVADFSITIAANAAKGTGTFTLTPTQDKVVEGSESLTISGSGTGLNVSSASIALTDDDTAPAVNLSVSPTSVTEGEKDALLLVGDYKTVTVTATFSNANTYDHDKIVAVAVGGSGTATSGADYTAVSNFNVKISGGQKSGTGTFNLTSSDDSVYEGSETIGVAGTSSGLTVNSVNLTLADNDNAAVTVNDASAAEGSSMTFTVTLDKAVQGGLTVTPSYTSGTASSGDYTANTSALSFTGTAGETKTFTVATVDDDVVEANETFTVGLSVSNAPAGVTSSDTGTGTINDDAANGGDVAAVTVNDASADEGDAITFTVTLDKAVQGGLTVTPGSYANVSAESGDYTANTSALTFSGTAGETKTFTVSTTEDAVLEADETFTVGLSVSNAPSGVTATDTGEGTIENDDGAALTINDTSATEGGSLTFTVVLDKAVEGGLKATPGYTNGTAETGDYTKNTTALTFSGTKGETKTFTVSTTEDAVLEANETFTVGLTVSNAPSGVTATDTGEGTIEDDDGAALTVNDTSATEGGSLTFTVVLDKAVEGGLKATPGYTNGTAESGDYTKNATALTFSGTKGETKTFTVSTTEDAVLEANETFTVGLTVSNAPAGVTSSDTGEGTIEDDDEAALTIDDADADEGNGVTFTVSLDEAVEGGFKVTPGYTNGTAASGDYTKNTTALTFSGTKGEEKTFTVSTTEDEDVEEAETFTVGLTVSGTALDVTSTDTGEGTINNDDGATVTVNNAGAGEGASMTFTVTLGDSVQGGLKVTPGYTNVTAESGDYTKNTSALTFSGTKGETKTFSVSTKEDAVVEADETFTVGLTVSDAPAGITATDTGTGTIDNDDSAEVTVNDAAADEGDAITFTVSLDAAVEGGLKATPGYANGTAESGDYVKNTSALTFSGTKGETKTFSVSTKEDAVVETDETFTVSLAVSDAPSGITSTDTGEGTIDNDDSAEVTVNDAAADEGDAITFTVTLDAAVEGGLTVTPGYANGTAESGDYVENATALSFSGTVNETKTFAVSTTQDAVVEAAETFTVDLTVSDAPAGITATDTGEGTIDNDDSATLTIDADGADEGGAITFTVTLDAAVEGGLTVTPAYTDGTAVEGVDYVANTTPIDFAGTVGESHSFAVTTMHDETYEHNETFTVSMVVSNAPTDVFSVNQGAASKVAASLPAGIHATDTAQGAILDDDGAGVAVTVNDASAIESKPMTFTVTLSKAVQGGLTVTPAFTDVTAEKGVDYRENTTPIDFAGRRGETKTFAVATIGDGGVVENDETFTVTLAVSNTALVVDATDAGTGTIVNVDKYPRVTLAGPSDVQNGAFDVTATFSTAVTGFSEDDVVVGNGAVTALAGSADAYTVTVTPAASGTVTVDVGSDKAFDHAGNGNIPADPFAVEADVDSPTVVLTGPSDVQTDAFDVSIAFSEAVTGFEQGDVKVDNGTVTAFSGADDSYTATITPAAGGTVTIDVPAGVAHDAAGNGNLAARTAADGTEGALSVRADTDGPTAVITGPSAVQSGAFAVTVTFSEAVTGFSQSDVKVSNGSATALSGSGDSYTATITPAAGGTVTIDVPADAAHDAAGNGNLAADPFTVEALADAPTVTIDGPSDAQTGAFDVTVTFSEAVTGFEQGDVNADNGTVAALSGSGDSYTATIAPSASGTVTIDVPADVARDADGNGNLSADPFSVEADLSSVLVQVTPTAGLTTTEAGGTAAFTVALKKKPTASVVIGVASSDSTEGVVAVDALTFTAGAWDAPQTVTVTGVDDDVDDGDRTYAVALSPAVSDDPGYSGADPADVILTNANDDVAGITVTPTAGLILSQTGVTRLEAGAPANGVPASKLALATSEAGVSVTFTVALDTRPVSDVTLHLSSSDPSEGQVSPEALTFTPGDDAAAGKRAASSHGAWDAPQTVTVTGVPDDLRDGDVEYTIILSPAVSRDAKYHGMDPDDVTITNVGGVTLKDLVLSTGPLSPSFASATWEYASATGNGTNAVTVTATVSNPDVAALTINGATARSGAASDPIALAVGQNAILVAVTNGRVGLTTTYVVDLTRRENNAPSGLTLADQTAMAGTAFHYAFAEVHDPDPDQTITYTAAMDGGGALPGWLRFEPETRAFSGTPQGADAGASVIAVTAADDGVPSKAALATFTLTVSAPDVNAHALRLGLAAFGRTVASNAVDAIDSRFSDAEARGTTLGGRAVTTNGNGGKAAGLLWGLAHSAGLTVNLPDANALETLPGHDLRPDAPVRFQRRALDDALSQSAFLLKPGAGEGDNPSPWAFWGRGAAAGFSSAEDGMALDGRVFSAFIGLDRRLKNDVTLGVAYARSTGQIDYTGAGGDQGEMDVALNSVAPYVRWAAETGMSAWGMGGAGWGTAKVADRYHDAQTDISMIMGALGARHPVASLGRVALALKGDAFALGIGSDARVNVAATEADAQRLRFALEGSADHVLSAAAVLSPRLEIGGRWDRGSAETGLGAEVGGGVDLRHDPSGWGLETRGTLPPDAPERGL